ncbi:MAG: GID complex subunit containing RING finger motif [Claussenomyces sp. TS43310]|nr:MAG: GID complex subunit containing RING finger motif [Claussenomyces sp. TS43310]
MAEHITSKLNPDTHLLLDQPLLRLPYELLRKNFKVAQLSVEKDSTAVRNSLKDSANASLSNSSSPDEVLKNLDSMIARMRGLKRKLSACAEEEARLQQHSQSRIRHLNELYSMQSLDDVQYEAWSRTRLDRLLVDYMLRNGYKESATALAQEKGIEELVDVGIFVQMSRVRESLREHKVTEALAWCTENKKELRRAGSKLEFMLRFQQYIELVRMQDEHKLQEAISHFRKYLVPSRELYPTEVQQAGGLLAFPPGCRPSIYEELYSQSRWDDIAKLFMQTHNSLLSLPSAPLLHIALSAGLSALKTPSCHSTHLSSSASPSSSSSITISVCPICSTELNDLARNVPYAQHTKSHVDPDARLLPNGRVYGLKKLQDYSRKAGLEEGMVKDLRTGQVFLEEGLTKVYIS